MTHEPYDLCVEELDLVASHLVVGGAALAREVDGIHAGRVVFVSGALPGERVRVALRTAKKDFAAGDVVDVQGPSPDRVDPACEAWHRGCGGCDWQHIEPSAQLAHKVEIVREALSRTGRLADPRVAAAGSAPSWGYRTTIRVAVSGRNVGFRSRRSHDIVSIAACPVANPMLNRALAELAQAPPPGGGEVTLRASVATGELNVSIGTATEMFLTETVDGRSLRVSIGSFFQSSPEAAELLVAAVRRACADIDIASSRVIDAYGGGGLFAATVAAGAAEIVLVEGSPSACADARVNLAGENAVVVESRVEDWEPERADLVIADPARSGLDKVAAAVLAATGAAVIVLVSCDTGSLARDVRLLQALGFEHDGTAVIDAFPNTSHIETVTRFVRSSGSVGRADE